MGILANNDGKILRANQHGSVLRQNYNFGGFVNPSNHIIDIPSLSDYNFNNEFSVFNYRKDGDLSPETRSGIFNINDGDISQNSISFGYDFEYTNHSVVTYENGNVPLANNRAASLDVMYFHSDLSIPRVEILNSVESFNKTAFVNPDILSPDLSVPNKNVVVGFGYGRAGFLGYDRSRRGMFLIYTRDLSTNELAYLYNNYLGNEPLNRMGLLVEFKYYNAEIFDFGGTIGQAVGVRDYSGNNNHGRIMNLPAGTLQEQLDYANANLFEQW